MTDEIFAAAAECEPWFFFFFFSWEYGVCTDSLPQRWRV